VGSNLLYFKGKGVSQHPSQIAEKEEQESIDANGCRERLRE
jgi:hypothetical protein